MKNMKYILQGKDRSVSRFWEQIYHQGRAVGKDVEEAGVILNNLSYY
jgi:hypothetical protein